MCCCVDLNLDYLFLPFVLLCLELQVPEWSFLLISSVPVCRTPANWYWEGDSNCSTWNCEAILPEVVPSKQYGCICCGRFPRYTGLGFVYLLSLNITTSMYLWWCLPSFIFHDLIAGCRWVDKGAFWAESSRPPPSTSYTRISSSIAWGTSLFMLCGIRSCRGWYLIAF